MKSKYNTLAEWCKADPKAYDRARKLKLKNEICIMFGWALPKIITRKPKGYWTKEKCVEEALNYNSIKEWRKFNQMSYKIAYYNDWLIECTAHIDKGRKPRGYWDKEKCIEEALKYKTRTQFLRNNKPCYNSALKNGWIDECAAHMVENQKPMGYWDKERCIEHAKQFSTVTEWLKANSTPCANARKNGWYEEATTHMVQLAKPRGYWTKERSLEIALKCNSYNDWIKISKSSYNSALRNGWLEECSKHMVKGNKDGK